MSLTVVGLWVINDGFVVGLAEGLDDFEREGSKECMIDGCIEKDGTPDCCIEGSSDSTVDGISEAAMVGDTLGFSVR